METAYLESDIDELDSNSEIPPGALIARPQSQTSTPPLALLAKNYEEVFLPSLSLEQAQIRFDLIRQAAKQLLKDGVDFGRIPGTQGECLLLPGAEKLAAFFGLTVHVYAETVIRERKPDPFFLFSHKAVVSKGGVVIAECTGECNSEEDCWKVWVKVPPPDKDTQTLMLAEKRGKWTDWSNIREWSEKRDHPNPFTLLNNASKRSQKRAYVGAVKKALGISDLFAKPLPK